ncbi:hypothetical protein FACS1894104_2890 [Actinomycetota bacterium]|nr:hypothetical protein FACS1894104_2890 [Actinomycetota bacterium]
MAGKKINTGRIFWLQCLVIGVVAGLDCIGMGYLSPGDTLEANIGFMLITPTLIIAVGHVLCGLLTHRYQKRNDAEDSTQVVAGRIIAGIFLSLIVTLFVVMALSSIIRALS